MNTPIKVTFELDLPMASPAYPIHLDALIAKAVTEKKLARMKAGREKIPEGMMLRQLADDLPLGKEEKEGEWVWMASALIPEGVLDRDIQMWTRRIDPEDIAEAIYKGQTKLSTRAMTVIEKGTPLGINIEALDAIPTARLGYFPTEQVTRLHAWCVGDIDVIESLIAPESGFITSIGKWARTSRGNIKAFTINEDRQALTMWKHRVLPWKEYGYVEIQAAIRPPYWAPENSRMAFLPPGV